jgi:hypothetical protein
MRGFPTLSSEPTMEAEQLNQLEAGLKDLAQRSSELRGYL